SSGFLRPQISFTASRERSTGATRTEVSVGFPSHSCKKGRRPFRKSVDILISGFPKPFSGLKDSLSDTSVPRTRDISKKGLEYSFLSCSSFSHAAREILQ